VCYLAWIDPIEYDGKRLRGDADPMEEGEILSYAGFMQQSRFDQSV